MGQPRPLFVSFCFFLIFSNKQDKFYNNLSWNNDHPVSGAGMRTHNLLITSLSSPLTTAPVPVNVSSMRNCQLLNSNCRPLVSESNCSVPMPTASAPLPRKALVPSQRKPIEMEGWKTGITLSRYLYGWCHRTQFGWKFCLLVICYFWANFRGHPVCQIFVLYLFAVFAFWVTLKPEKNNLFA